MGPSRDRGVWFFFFFGGGGGGGVVAIQYVEPHARWSVERACALSFDALQFCVLCALWLILNVIFTRCFS